MFHFMKKDKHDKEHKDKKDKDEKKKEKKEKKEKEKKEKQREPMTQDELKKLDEVKKGVFRRFSDRDKRKSSQKVTSPEESPVLQDSSDSSISTGRPSPSREVPGRASELTKPQRLPSKGDVEKPDVLPKPKPRSILKGGAAPQQVSANVDDSSVLQQNTKLNELTAHLTNDVEKEQAVRPKEIKLQNQSPAPSPSNSDFASPPIHEKSFKSDLKLPDIVPPKAPRVRELTLQRQPAGDFGFTLRKAFITNKKSDHEDESKVVIFAEPGSGGRGLQTGLIPGDKLIAVNGVTVSDVSREEIVEMIRKSGDSVTVKVQPIQELIELSVRPQQDGSSVEVQEEVSKGGTLKRSGSIRFKKAVST